MSVPHLTTQNVVAYALDIASAGAIIGTILGVLPYIAALAGFIWYCIQIWESKTVSRWRERIGAHFAAARIARRAKEIAALRAREKLLQAERTALEGKQNDASKG